MKKITYEYLQANGEKIASACEGSCFLYLLNGKNFVVLQDNSVITQEEDNEAYYGLTNAIFPDF